MNMAGYNTLFNTDKKAPPFLVASMVKVLADYSSATFHQAYGGVVTFIGLLGGFITGSETSAIAMFAKYTMTTGKELGWGITGMIILTAGMAFGGGLASVISPAKLQNAAASIDKVGEETTVIRVAFVFSIFMTLVTSFFVVAFLAIMAGLSWPVALTIMGAILLVVIAVLLVYAAVASLSRRSGSPEALGLKGPGVKGSIRGK